MTHIVSPPLQMTPKIRYWYWRGWRIRYAVLPVSQPTSQLAPPLLLLHGFGSSLEQWRSNFSTLAAGRTVYALDLLGFGDSQKAATLFSTDLWSAQVYDFWRIWMGCPIVLVGHSLGALVALNTAVQYPKMAHRLILLTLPAAREELLTGWVESFSSKMEQLFSTPLLIRPIFQLFRQPWVIRSALRGIYQAKGQVDADLVEQFVRPTDDRGAARTLCYLVRSRTESEFTPKTKQLVPQLKIPTLLLWGDADKIIPVSWGEQLAPLNSLVTLTIVPKVGHCLYDEDPHVINGHILIWLQETDSVLSG